MDGCICLLIELNLQNRQWAVFSLWPTVCQTLIRSCVSQHTQAMCNLSTSINIGSLRNLKNHFFIFE